jgi:hypothetical protein
VAVDDPPELARYATALADAIDRALPGWVVGCVERVMGDVTPDIAGEAEAAGDRARAELMPEVRRLLATDVDRQWTGPLDLLRRAVPYPTAVLRAAGVPPRPRDEVAARLFPDDIYDLAPASFVDLDPELRDAGIEWGAAKAHTVLTRRRKEGRR